MSANQMILPLFDTSRKLRREEEKWSLLRAKDPRKLASLIISKIRGLALRTERAYAAVPVPMPYYKAKAISKIKNDTGMATNFQLRGAAALVIALQREIMQLLPASERYDAMKEYYQALLWYCREIYK